MSDPEQELNRDDLFDKMTKHEIQPTSSRQEVPNTQWQYLIVDEDGSVHGTNNVKAAKEFAASEVDSVIHVPTCQAVGVLEDGTMEYHNIPEQTTYEL